MTHIVFIGRANGWSSAPPSVAVGFKYCVPFLKGHRQYHVIAHSFLAPLPHFQPRLYGCIHHTDN
jgi:hypothetical protein